MPTVEERLAALETKLAALTETTPTTYYEHQYSGEEIDAAVGRALTGGALDISVTNVSNQLGTFVRPNLLDNWYFGNPVNQRGQTEYTISWNQYSVDRWSCEGDAVYVRIEQDGIVIKNNGSSEIQFKQIFPDGLIPVGSAVTMSALCTSVSGICHLTYAQAGDPYSPSIQWTQIVAGVVTTAHGVQIGGQHKAIIGLEPGAEIKILAAKLELGPTQTLAHKEGERWVLNGVPEYGEQLRRCQRYFVRINNVYASGHVALNNTTYVDFATPVPLRTNPALTMRSYGLLSSAGTLITPSAIQLAAREENHIYLGIITPTLTERQPACLHDASIDFSADL